MLRARVAPTAAHQLVILGGLVVCLWLMGLLLAWTVALSAPVRPAAGAAPRPHGPSLEVAPKRWLLVPTDMS